MQLRKGVYNHYIHIYSQLSEFGWMDEWTDSVKFNQLRILANG